LVKEIANTPPLAEPAEHQIKMWMGETYQAQLDTAEKEGDPGALAALRGTRRSAAGWVSTEFSKVLTRRATLTREWQVFFDSWAVLLIPVCGDLPFPNGFDLRDEESWRRAWRAQMPQVGLPFVGMPAMTVTTGLVGTVPVGVLLVRGALPREDLCLLAG
jgi:amidase